MSDKDPTVRRFWNWTNPTPQEEAGGVRVLHLSGVIAEESWFDDDIAPALFKNKLNAGSGDVEVWVNSPGGDCIAAAQIYNMLTEYPGRVTVIIDGLAAEFARHIGATEEETFIKGDGNLRPTRPISEERSMGNE